MHDRPVLILTAKNAALTVLSDLAVVDQHAIAKKLNLPNPNTGGLFGAKMFGKPYQQSSFQH
jgi:hypothetical protein